MKIQVKGPSIDEIVKNVKTTITHEMERRSYLAANELRNSALMVLRGQRSGRRYKVPGTYRRQRDKKPYGDGKMKNGRYYTASAPGEPPAVRTSAFRNSWQATARYSGAHNVYWSRIESDATTDNGRYNLGEILENGTGRMAPRPYQDRILEHAEPKIVRIYSKPYF